jgi:Arc/MetJ family transcription regulator
MRKPRTTAKGAGVAVKSGSRTNIVLDERLVARVKRLSRAKTTREAVHVALEHYARSRDYSKVLALYGSGGVAKDYDPKATNPV